MPGGDVTDLIEKEDRPEGARSSLYLQVGREGHVDLLPVRRDSVQEQRVVHGAVPGCLEAVEGPEMIQTKETAQPSARELPEQKLPRLNQELSLSHTHISYEHEKN